MGERNLMDTKEQVRPLTGAYEIVEACESMVALLIETGLSDDQEAYCDVISRQLSELKRVLANDSPKQEAEPGDAVATLCALVVDDDEVQRLFISRALERHGFSVVTARDGEEAVRAFTRERFDVVVMDCQLPVLDGFGATLKIRELEQALGIHTPIVAYTGHHIAGYKQLCLKSGMDQYLKKPMASREFAEAVRSFVRERTGKNFSRS